MARLLLLPFCCILLGHFLCRVCAQLPTNLGSCAASNLTLRTIAGGGTGTVAIANGVLAANVNLTTAYGVTIDPTYPTGSLYFSDAGAHRVYSVSLTGVLNIACGVGTASFSGDGGPAASAAVNAPRGVLWEPAVGGLVVADGGNNRVRLISSATGIISTIAGSGLSCSSSQPTLATPSAATSVSLCVPRGLLYVNGTLYIADSRIVAALNMSDSRIRLVAGFPAQAGAYGGTTGPGLQLLLDNPEGLAWNPVAPDGSGPELLWAEVGGLVLRSYNTSTTNATQLCNR